MNERIFLHLDFSSPVPLYAQLVGEMKRAVALGHYAEEGRLPSVRELAVKLRINPNTVAKAYDLLVSQGVVRAHKGLGFFIDASKSAGDAARRSMEERIGAAAAEALALGISRRDFYRMVARQVRRLTRSPA